MLTTLVDQVIAYNTRHATIAPPIGVVDLLCVDSHTGRYFKYIDNKQQTIRASIGKWLHYHYTNHVNFQLVKSRKYILPNLRQKFSSFLRWPRQGSHEQSPFIVFSILWMCVCNTITSSIVRFSVRKNRISNYSLLPCDVVAFKLTLLLRLKPIVISNRV